MLHGLLHQHLDDAFLTADVERHLPHLTGKELADHEEDGREQQQGPGQTGVHHVHEQEGPQELNKGDGDVGHQGGGGIAHHVDVLLQTRGDIARVQFLLLEHLTTEQMTEDAQADGRALSGTVLHHQIVINLTTDNACTDSRHQSSYHQQDIVGATCPDGHVDELFAEPHHEQTERHASDARHDAHQHIPPDAPRVLPKPDQVFRHLRESVRSLSSWLQSS